MTWDRLDDPCSDRVDRYRVLHEGDQVETVAPGVNRTTVSDIEVGDDISVVAVDAAGRVSDPATETVGGPITVDPATHTTLDFDADSVDVNGRVTGEIRLQRGVFGSIPDHDAYEVHVELSTPCAARIDQVWPAEGLDSSMSYGTWHNSATLTVEDDPRPSNPDSGEKVLGTVTVEGMNEGGTVVTADAELQGNDSVAVGGGSDSLAVTVPENPAPTNVSGHLVETARAELSWNHLSDPCEDTIDHFEVIEYGDRATTTPADTDDGEPIATTPAGVTRTTIGIDWGETVDFAVVAVDSDGSRSDPARGSVSNGHSVDPGDRAVVRGGGTVAPGESTTVDVVVRPGVLDPSYPPLSDYEVSVRAQTSCAVEITDIAAPDGVAGTRSVEDNRATLTVEGGPPVDEDSATLATVTLVGRTAGVGSVIEVTDVTRPDSDDSVLQGRWGTVDVESTPPDPPANLTLSQGRGSDIRATWEGVATPCDTRVDHYAVSVDGTRVQTVPAGATATTITPSETSGTATVGVEAVSVTGRASETVTETIDYVHADVDRTLDLVAQTETVDVSETVAVDLARNEQSSAPIGETATLESVTVGLSTPCAARITGATAPSGSTSVSDDGRTVTIEWAEDHPEPVGTIASVDVTGRQAGHTRLEIDAVTADGFVSTQGTRLGVTAERVPAVAGNTPTDPDGDGIYEDITGDGRVNFPDVNALFQHTDDQSVENGVAFFDITDDGRVDMQDVLALFESI